MTLLPRLLLGTALLAPAQVEGRRQGSSTTQRPVLMSIKPSVAPWIMDGSKRYEIRKTRPVWGAGVPVLLYASSEAGEPGQRQLVGSFVSGDIRRGTVQTFWRELRPFLGDVKLEEVVEYLGQATGYAIEIREPRRLARPVPLEELRRLERGFRPPQSYQYIQPTQQHLLRALGR